MVMDSTAAGAFADQVEAELNSLEENAPQEGDGQSKFTALNDGASQVFSEFKHPLTALGNGNPAPAIIEGGALRR